MRISERITALCAAVEQGERVADIGTDHGYVPLLLYRKGIAPAVIMSDISEGSLAKAQASFRRCGISLPPEAFRLGDGLASITAGEVEVVVIGGLGGITILEILDEDIEKTRSFRKLILQPRNNSGALRAYLYRRGFSVSREILAAEGKFVCEIIVAEPSEVCERMLPYAEDDIRWQFPPQLVACGSPLLEEKIRRRKNSLRGEIANLERSKEAREERIAALREAIAYLDLLLERRGENHEG